jgi:CheY-like chemotaxis protein
VTRLVGQYTEGGMVRSRQGRGQRFSTRYNPGDVALLAQVDEAHDTLSGPATQKILYRQYHEFAEAAYERLAEISVAHIYNLRKRRSYREHRMVFTKTRPTPVSIGERRKPEPGGRPGYLRVDTVHQGDLDGAKGVYHINAVDEVTQWQVVGAVEHISEAWLEPLLLSMLALDMLFEEEIDSAPLPDLILLDWNLPKVTGSEVLARIKEHPKLRPTPVLVFSSSEANKDIHAAYDNHANGYITKPDTADALGAIVETIERFWIAIAKLPKVSRSVGLE